MRSIIFYGNPSVFSSVYIYLHSRKILKTKSNQENFIILFQFCDAILYLSVKVEYMMSPLSY